MRPNRPLFALLMVLVALGGCSRAYYAAWEKLGKEKRDLLRDHVQRVQGEQKAAGEQFESALDRLRALTGASGSALEKQYDRLRADQEKAEQRAAAVRERAQRIRTVAADLFTEWEREIGDISSADLRARSRRSLAETKQRFARLDAALGRSEASMEPVLGRLRDQVLFLKHNLNAQAVAGLSSEVAGVGREVDALLADLRASMAEADRFISQLPR